jgi:hypothetical protein
MYKDISVFQQMFTIFKVRFSIHYSSKKFYETGAGSKRLVKALKAWNITYEWKKKFYSTDSKFLFV